MATMVSYDEDLQKAIQLSIQGLSFEQQFQLAQRESEREENRRQKVAAELGQMSFEEQLRLAEEMSLKDAPQRPILTKHFQELNLPSPDICSEQRVRQLNGRRNHRPYQKDDSQTRGSLIVEKLTEILVRSRKVGKVKESW